MKNLTSDLDVGTAMEYLYSHHISAIQYAIYVHARNNGDYSPTTKQKH